MMRVAILGATGSIGTSALAVAEAHPDRVRVVGLAAGEQRRGDGAQRWPRHRPWPCRWPPAPALDAAARGARAALPPAAGVGARGPGGGGHAPRRRPRAVRVVGHRGARSGAGRHRRRQDHRAGQQGSAGHGRRPRDGPRRAPRACRSCRSTASTTPSTSACTAIAPRDVRRLILTASGGPFRGRTPRQPGRGDRRRGAAPSDLADGAEDHHRLGHADEQGPRGHRGALALRRAGRRRSTSSCIRSRSCTRWSSSPTARCWRSWARPTCACRSSTPSPIPSGGRAPVPFLDLARAGTLEFHAAGLGRVSVPAPGLSARSRPIAACRSC